MKLPCKVVVGEEIRSDFFYFNDPCISVIMNLADVDKALVCSGPVSNYSYDSHIVTRSNTITIA